MAATTLRTSGTVWGAEIWNVLTGSLLARKLGQSTAVRMLLGMLLPLPLANPPNTHTSTNARTIDATIAATIDCMRVYTFRLDRRDRIVPPMRACNRPAAR